MDFYKKFYYLVLVFKIISITNQNNSNQKVQHFSGYTDKNNKYSKMKFITYYYFFKMGLHTNFVFYIKTKFFCILKST